MSNESRRRWISLGEAIALAALAVSAAGVWIAWKSSDHDGPTQIVEKRPAIPLALRGTISDDGRTLTIVPADQAHALQSLQIKIAGAPAIDIGSDGRVSSGDIEAALKGRAKEAKEVAHILPLRIQTRYVEAGADRRATSSYSLRYKWVGGGLFGGRSLRFISFSRT